MHKLKLKFIVHWGQNGKLQREAGGLRKNCTHCCAFFFGIEPLTLYSWNVNYTLFEYFTK